jgi:glutaredoxin
VEQRCPLVNVWLAWVGLPLLALVVGIRAGWIVGVVVLAAGVVFQMLYVLSFPRVSRLLGYGSVDDVPATSAASPATSVKRVTFYTASACPFCPIVRRRLVALQENSGFELEEVDVTFRPDLVRAKGLKGVPVVEANGQLLVGNATSQQLAAFLAGSATQLAGA